MKEVPPGVMRAVAVRSALSRIRSAIEGFIDIVYPEPPPCALCFGEVPVGFHVAVCERCLARLPRVDEAVCGRCGRPVRRGEARCGPCAKLPSAVDYARSYGLYQGHLKASIHALKYRGEVRVAEALGELMAWAAWWDGGFERIDRLVPVPLHPAKERERGYNQAELLARAAAEAMGKRVIQPVVRTRETLPQSGLSLSERRRNVESAFEVPLPGEVRGLRLLVVDDVYTTGATLSAVCAALKRAGARTCYALCAAVSVLDRDLLTPAS